MAANAGIYQPQRRNARVRTGKTTTTSPDEPLPSLEVVCLPIRKCEAKDHRFAVFVVLKLREADRERAVRSRRCRRLTSGARDLSDEFPDRCAGALGGCCGQGDKDWSAVSAIMRRKAGLKC
jgi:hypothetical protein